MFCGCLNNNKPEKGTAFEMGQCLKPHTVELPGRDFNKIRVPIFQLLIIPSLYITFSASWYVNLINIWLDSTISVYQTM
jgi:hypothetical protein